MIGFRASGLFSRPDATNLLRDFNGLLSIHCSEPVFKNAPEGVMDSGLNFFGNKNVSQLDVTKSLWG